MMNGYNHRHVSSTVAFYISGTAWGLRQRIRTDALSPKQFGLLFATYRSELKAETCLMNSMTLKIRLGKGNFLMDMCVTDWTRSLFRVQNLNGLDGLDLVLR